jgi:hypothetical protein
MNVAFIPPQLPLDVAGPTRLDVLRPGSVQVERGPKEQRPVPAAPAVGRPGPSPLTWSYGRFS